jgi:hypothetical protein
LNYPFTSPFTTTREPWILLGTPTRMGDRFSQCT